MDLKSLGVFRDRRTFQMFSCWFDPVDRCVLTVGLNDAGCWPVERFEAQFERKSA
ncbi:MAG: hypothetical protein KGL39_15695 [Patescibacteria group bacterium]|nr:hypothetical protein [Patescibacteria group bacterium]